MIAADGAGSPVRRMLEIPMLGPIGFYYYDGSHDYKSQSRALELASPYLVPGSLILVDDTNWDAPRSATQDFIAMDGRPYDVLLDIKTAGNLSPFFWNGLMLLQVGHEHTH